MQTPSGAVTLVGARRAPIPGDLLKLRGKGVQTRPTPGDLLVRLMIVLPRKDDAELREFVEDLGGPKDRCSAMNRACKR